MQVFSVCQQVVVYLKSKFKTIGDAEEECDGLSVESYMGDPSGDVENVKPQPDNLPLHLRHTVDHLRQP